MNEDKGKQEFIGMIVIGIILIVLGIIKLVYDLHLAINYGWDYEIIGYSRLAGRTVTAVKSAILFDILVLILGGIGLVSYAIYKQFFSIE